MTVQVYIETLKVKHAWSRLPKCDRNVLLTAFDIRRSRLCGNGLFYLHEDITFYSCLILFSASLPELLLSFVSCLAYYVAMDCIRWYAMSNWHFTARVMKPVSVPGLLPLTMRGKVSWNYQSRGGWFLMLLFSIRHTQPCNIAVFCPDWFTFPLYWHVSSY